MLYTMFTVDHIESMGFISLGTGPFGELHAVIGQHRMYPVRQLLHNIFRKGCGLIAIGLLVKPGMDKFRSVIHRHEQVCPTFAGANFADIKMQIADRIFPERLSVCLCPGFTWQPADVMTLIEAMQAGAGQMRDKALQCKQAVIQWQMRGSPEGDGSGFFHRRQRQ